MTDPKLKIAVFVDFDNIEIGVKTTLGGQFDIGLILEAIKERGEVVTKIAYGDWKRAGDHGRLLSQHAIRMVQRNLTPGGDKNGADINLALDALEMAFTHDHINAFVIVGGDSDFITLVEKLKQYDRKVFVVGGRQFTSLVMQRNCHEFIAYENLMGATRRPAGAGGGSRSRGGAPAAPVAADLDKALPLVKRALKVLADREVTPQLGLLKSTLLQLDSTFSERDYGSSTFRDFIEKVAERGLVTLKQAGRSVLVELADNAVSAAVPDTLPPPPLAEVAAAETPTPRAASRDAAAEAARDDDGKGPAPAPPTGEQTLDAVKLATRLFASAKQTPRWPMYIRQVRQFLRALDEGFDERKFGFAGIVEFLRACQRETLLRLERDRQGVIRVFPGPGFPKPAGGPAPEAIEDASEPNDVAEPRDVAAAVDVIDALAEPDAAVGEIVAEAGAIVVDGEVTSAVEDEPYTGPEPGNEAAPAPKSRSRTRSRPAAKRTATKSTRTRKKPA